MSVPRKPASVLALLGPGLLLAATGVGGGDLATASFVGDMLGTAVLWAAVVAAFLKFVVTEGLARWQLATGDTLLEGVAHRFGRVAIALFLPYLLLWSFFVGSAQMSANGVTLHAMLPVFDDARSGKIFFGVVSSLFGLALVLWGGYRAFEIVMRLCIGTMFARSSHGGIPLARHGRGATASCVMAPELDAEGRVDCGVDRRLAARSPCSRTATGCARSAARRPRICARAASISARATRSRLCSVWR
jgi:hypothetical protein